MFFKGTNAQIIFIFWASNGRDGFKIFYLTDAENLEVDST
jgi:hypothetical protein